jgi:hypothetical protein
VARSSNLLQVSAHITQYSAGNPVLVFGDTNTRYTRAGDNPTIFNTANQMTDVWVQLERSGSPPSPGSSDLICSNPATNLTCEIVDKVFYRGSPAVQLHATSFKYAGNMFLQSDGNILSDHNPVLVDFTWEKGESLRVSDPFGGPHGNFFNDLPDLSSITKPVVNSITLQGASRLDAVQVTLSSGRTFSHGGTGGTAKTLTLAAGESLVSAVICEGQKDGNTRVFYLQLTSSNSRTVEAGTKTSDCVTRSAEAGWGIVGFVGRSGDEVDRIGFVYGKL